ncbi:MAG TPA: ABC transporter ATP-binding protein [Firmicutes bacterium]|nr:ABC transporter ATP-binding protein [Bacillota bacterium]
MIRIENINKFYKLGKGRFHALKDVSLEIGDGEFVSVEGRSGAGKTTLLHILGCLDSFDSGTYLLNGKSVGKMGDRQLAAVRNREIGFVMQDFALVAQEDVLFNVMLPLYFSKTKHSRMKDLAAEKLERVGLSDQIGKKVSQLSGGQKQRVAIARALVAGSGIILADEPTGALDSGTGREVMELLRGINREQGTTVVVITHDAEVASYAGRRIVLADGVVEYDESA